MTIWLGENRFKFAERNLNRRLFQRSWLLVQSSEEAVDEKASAHGCAISERLGR